MEEGRERVKDIRIFHSLQTAELDKRLKSMGESQLREFALDVPSGSVYHFEGEDFREKKKVGCGDDVMSVGLSTGVIM